MLVHLLMLWLFIKHLCITLHTCRVDAKTQVPGQQIKSVGRYRGHTHPKCTRSHDIPEISGWLSGAGAQVAELFIGFEAASHLHNLVLRKCTVEFKMTSDVREVIQLLKTK